MDSQRALKMIEQHGVWGLSDSDGCLCANFEVFGVRVDISCRKSSGSRSVRRFAPEGFYGTVIRVHSTHLDVSIEELAPIGALLAKEMDEHYPHTIVRYCDYDCDDKCLCCWCNKPREEPAAYLCNACSQKEDASGFLSREHDIVIVRED